MRLSNTLSALSLVASVLARPTGDFVSILTGGPEAIRDLPTGRTPISRADMEELARLAIAVNTAYCPMDRLLQPHPSVEASSTGRHKRSETPIRHASSIVISSQDPEFASQAEEVDMSWYISHTPSTQTLTLAFSSLPTTDDLLDLLSSSPFPNATAADNFVELPSYLFPQEYLPYDPSPLIHHAYLPALETHGTSALLAVLDLLETPPVPTRTNRNVLQGFLNSLSRQAAPAAQPIKHVEIVGHGLGAAMALLVSVALHLEVAGPAAAAYDNPLPTVGISATLFGSPRVGEEVFAAWIDELQIESPELRINRVTSYADTIAHLPARHLDLVHPSIGEIWVGADPRVAYACRSESEGEESESCAASIPLPKTSLLDHAGPFGGIWIGQSKCRRPTVHGGL